MSAAFALLNVKLLHVGDLCTESAWEQWCVANYGGGGVVIEKVVIFVGVVTHYANIRVLYGLHNSYMLSNIHGKYVCCMLCREL